MSCKLRTAHFFRNYGQLWEVTVEGKPGFEQVNLINQLDEDDKAIVFKIIETMLTKKKFKDFFQKNVAAL